MDPYSAGYTFAELFELQQICKSMDLYSATITHYYIIESAFIIYIFYI
jgi:hypothetical protein